MAVSTGTATSYLDLLEKLRIFLTTGLASGQNWTVLKDSVEATQDRVLYFQAPGLAGTDQIYSVFYAFKDVPSDYYNLAVRGATGFNTLDPYNAQPGISSAVYAPMWNSSIPYWFIANGRRVIIFAKVSTVYVCLYAGFFIPHATPTEYPYPMAVGGCHYTAAKRWSVLDTEYKAFWNPAGNGSSSSAMTLATLLVRSPSGAWRPMGNYNGSGPDTSTSSGANVWPYTQWSDQKPIYGETTKYLLLPLIMHTDQNAGNVFGELDGIYYVAGFNNASENTITIGADTYTVFQNVYRTSNEHYCAVKME